jgi:hypothetical protein
MAIAFMPKMRPGDTSSWPTAMPTGTKASSTFSLEQNRTVLKFCQNRCMAGFFCLLSSCFSASASTTGPGCVACDVSMGRLLLLAGLVVGAGWGDASPVPAPLGLLGDEDGAALPWLDLADSRPGGFPFIAVGSESSRLDERRVPPCVSVCKLGEAPFIEMGLAAQVSTRWSG